MKHISKLLILVLGIFGMRSSAQINPMGTQYFQNRYVTNPAMAGMGSGFEAAGSLKAQWSGIGGAPLMQAVTLTHGSQNEKVGLGLSFYNERAGAIDRTSIKASYAYHLKLNDREAYIDFGLSAGYLSEFLDFNKLSGDLSDVSLLNFNQRGNFFDVDFGMNYRFKALTIQGVLPNIRNTWFSDQSIPVSDKFRYLLAGSYRFLLAAGTVDLEPMVVYRNVQNYGDIIDVAAQLRFYDGKLLFNGVYHSTGSVTAGVGTVYKNHLSILCQYTTSTSEMRGYSNGELEMGVKYRF